MLPNAYRAGPRGPADASLITQILPEVGGGPAEWWFDLSPVEPDPSWRSDLNSFAVFDFSEGEPVDPDGSPERPFHFAINQTMSGRLQVQAAAASILSTLRRQQRVAAAISETGSFSTLPEQIEAGDQASRGESASLATLLLAGQTIAASNLLSQYGRTLHFRWIPAWITEQKQFAARLSFLARSYNEIGEIRDAVDRIVSATVGSGGRMSSLSEEVRRAAERINIQGMLWRYMAHAVRDAEVSGLGIVHMSVRGATPRIRLIQPRMARVSPDLRHIEEWDAGAGKWSHVVGAFAMPGALQEAPSMPLSILEPLIPSLRAYYTMNSVVNDIDAFTAAGDPRGALLADQRLVADSMAATSKSAMNQILEPVTRLFPEPRHGLYFRGHESWMA